MKTTKLNKKKLISSSGLCGLTQTGAPLRGQLYQIPSKFSIPRQYLVIMIKVPVAGRVKTRLAHEMGTIAATNFYRHTLQILLRRLSSSSRWKTILSITPDNIYDSRGLPHNLPRLPQGTGNLGQRLERIFNRLGPSSTLIIGSDVPSIRYEHIAKAFHHLAGKKAVIGPSQDGGYWLIGLRGSHRSNAIFKTVLWSSNKALQKTLDNLSGRQVGILECLKDIDHKSDYQSETHLIGRNILSPFY